MYATVKRLAEKVIFEPRFASRQRVAFGDV